MLKDLKEKQATIDNLSTTITTLQNLIDTAIKSEPLLQNLEFLEKLVQIETDEEIQEQNRVNVQGFFYNSANYVASLSLTNKDIEVNVETLYQESKELTNSVSRFTGVRAMTGPVGVVYALSCEDKMNETVIGSSLSSGDHAQQDAHAISIEMKSIAIEATSIIIPNEKTTTEVINDMLVDIILNNCKHTTIKSNAGTNAQLVSLNGVANNIALNTRRGAGNIIMCSEKTESDFLRHCFQYSKVINNSVPDNIIIVCYVGTSNMDCGIIFAPYLLLNREVVNDEFVTIKQNIIRYGLAYNKDWQNYYQVLEIVDAE